MTDDARTFWPDVVQAIATIDEPPEWSAVRRSTLDRYAQLCLDELANPYSGRPFEEGWKRWQAMASRLADPHWLPKRPGRREPSVPKIAKYWAERGGPFEVDLDDPRCFGCTRAAPGWVSGWFERAHLVDRARGGLDHAPNLALLCSSCHRVMPMFDVHEGPAAIAWVLAGGVRGEIADYLDLFRQKPAM